MIAKEGRNVNFRLNPTLWSEITASHPQLKGELPDIFPMVQKSWVNYFLLPPLLEQYISITNGNELDAWLKKEKPTNKPCGEIPSPLPTTRNASNHKWNDVMK